jgi:hypothetical protein
MNNVGNEEDCPTKEEVENNPQWGEEFIVMELFHRTKTNQHLRFEDLPIYMSQNVKHYYVDMPHSPIVLDH